MCNSNGHFFNGFRPNLQSHFAGIGGVWHRQGAASTSQPASNPPGGGRMGDDRGGFARPLPGAACGAPACAADAPMWCDGRRRNGRTGRDTIRGQPADSSAPENPGEAHAVEGLVKKTYIIKNELPFSLKKLAYLLATAGIYSRCHRLLVVRIAD